MPKGPFDEEFTPEEEAALKSDAVPPAEEAGEGSVEDAIAAAATEEEKPAVEEPNAGTEAEPKAPAATEPPKPTPEEEAAAEERDLAAFLEKHKGKSAEEIARLALQQTKRANRAEATNRQTNQRLEEIGARARALSERRAQLASQAETRKAQFREKLTSDPDAATAEIHDRLVDDEVAAADEAARQARFDQALAVADEHIPDFGKQWPAMKSLANEFGYSDAELDNIDDGRALVMLSLANHSARLIKAGIMDRSGNIDMSKIPAPSAADPTDPRLTAPTPPPTLGMRAGSTTAAQTIEQQLAAIDAMSDTELAKFERENPGKIDELLQKAAA